jgi:hypothetical protein
VEDEEEEADADAAADAADEDMEAFIEGDEEEEEETEEEEVRGSRQGCGMAVWRAWLRFYLGGLLMLLTRTWRHSLREMTRRKGIEPE